MNFSQVYGRMNVLIEPTPALVEQTLRRVSRPRTRRFPRRLAALAAAAALCLATPALAVRTEMGYQLLYLVSPAAAQFFHPVQESCTDQGVTMEVAAVRVAGDTAQACITLSGGAVDATTDLFDSYSFHLPFDQIGHCERLNWDEATGTVTFLCTVQTMDGSAIPTGGKMTFSVRQLLTGKEQHEDVAVALELSDYARTAAVSSDYAASSGPDEASVPMLLPGETLAQPVEGIPITAAGYINGLFHVQAFLGDIGRTDNHCQLWLEDEMGNHVSPVNGAYFRNYEETDPNAAVYEDFLFDVEPEDLDRYTLHGNFYTASTLTEGLWQVTFRLENLEA